MPSRSRPREYHGRRTARVWPQRGRAIGDRSLEIQLNREIEWITGQIYEEPWADHVFARGAFADTGAVALVGGSDVDPVFTRLDGEPLPEADVAKLESLWNAAWSRFGIDRLPR